MYDVLVRVSLLALVILLLAGIFAAFGRDDGRYAQSPLRQWFQTLQNGRGANCCDGADGKHLEDAEWGTDQDGYWVVVDGIKYRVPHDALVITKNRAGTAIVWPYQDQDGKTQIRCFLPGVLS